VPVYEYACTDCGEQLEVRQSFTDDALTVCPACAGRLRKVLSAVGVVFKGSGFYRTDSRAAAAEANGSAKADANIDGSPDAKPGDKPNAKPEAKPTGPAEKPSPAGKNGSTRPVAPKAPATTG
jgi:putative FmdB family regulatory protein